MVVVSQFNRADILRTWAIFRQPCEVIELRILHAGYNNGTISGYFDDAKMFADAVVALADEPYPAYYFTINPVNPELLARASNVYLKKAKYTSADKDIIVLHWLPMEKHFSPSTTKRDSLNSAASTTVVATTRSRIFMRCGDGARRSSSS